MPANPWNRLLAFRVLVSAMVISAALITAGCGPSVGDVSGTVTYKNAPLKSGSVTVMSKGGAMQANIKENGTYEVKNVPAGEAKVTIVCNDDAKMLRQVQEASAKGRGGKGAGGGGGGQEVAPNFSLIPEVYSDLTNTPLQTTVKRGKNTYNIELK